MAEINDAAIAAIMGLGAAFLMFLIILFVAVYVYMSYTLMTVAKKTNTKNPWLAWIPIGNLVLMSDIARMPWWPVLLVIGFIIPVLNIFFIFAVLAFVVIWTWKICERLSEPGWWAILTLVPFAGVIWNLIMWGILAWDESAKESQKTNSTQEVKNESLSDPVLREVKPVKSVNVKRKSSHAKSSKKAKTSKRTKRQNKK